MSDLCPGGGSSVVVCDKVDTWQHSCGGCLGSYEEPRLERPVYCDRKLMVVRDVT
jgi:hypothetical protein